MTTDKSDVRISFRLQDPSLAFELRALLAHGQQQAIYNALTKDLVRLLKGPNRHLVIGALTSGDLPIEKISTQLLKHKDEFK